MATTTIEFKLSLPVGDIPLAHRTAAEDKAREAFVLELLRQGDISAGRAAELLAIDRGRLSELMWTYDISPFGDLTREELEREVAGLAKHWEK